MKVLPPEVTLEESPTATAITLVNDDRAPAFKAVRTDKLYPYRQKEVVTQVKARLLGVKVSPHDMQCVRKVHDIDSNPTFFYKSQFSSPQYSDAFIKWFVEQYQEDSGFFRKAREARRKKQ